MRKKFTCYRCGKYVETEMDDNGDATCPACENVIELEPERRFQTRIASLEAQLSEAKARLAGYEWIPVGERLPKFDKSVLFFIPDAETVTQGYRWRTPLGWRWSTEEDALFEQSKVTHWMPLPSAPKEDE